MMGSFQFKSQENMSLRKRIMTDIREAIINGQLKPGDKLKELDISQQMGVSQGPVREALRDLEAMGLVVSSPYRETTVATVHRSEMVDLLIPLRLQLELYVVKHSRDKWDGGLFDRLQGIVLRMRTFALDGNLFALAEQDLAFHETVLAMDDSSYTQQIWASIVNRLRLHFIKNTNRFNDLNKVPEDHQALIDVMREGRYERIEALWTHHIRHEDCLLCFEEG